MALELLTSSETCQGDVVVLAAAGSMHLDRLDNSLSQSARRERSALKSVVDPFDLKLHVFDVHGVSDPVRKNEHTVAWRQLDLARGVVEAIHHA